MLKKFFQLFFTTALTWWPARALAYDYGAADTARGLGYDTGQSVYNIIALATGVVLSLLAIVFFGLMMYAGIRWMTARGNEDLAEKAQHALIAATIGFVIVVLSYALTRFLFVNIGQ